MLEELTIKNFAIIDQISISFEKGLTVLTGETGAGKSIIIDAIGLLLGGRGSVEYVRYGESRAEIGTMLPVAEEAIKYLEKQGVQVTLINANSAKPLDEKLLEQLAERNIPMLTLEEAALQGGFGSAVLEFFNGSGYQDLTIKRMGIPDYFIEHGSVSRNNVTIN